jgi:Protein of unknown function (DUF3634)
MELLAKLVFIGLAVGVLWLVCQPRYVFVVRIESGKPRVSRGKVTAGFLHQVGEICGSAGVACGWMGGVLRGKRIALLFSRSIPPSCRQRLRNQWLLHG